MSKGKESSPLCFRACLIRDLIEENSDQQLFRVHRLAYEVKMLASSFDLSVTLTLGNTLFYGLSDCCYQFSRDVSSNAISALPNGVFSALTNLNEL